MITIKKIVDKLPGTGLDVNKVREKIREIIGLCGLDENVFKTGNAFQFPDESEQFIVGLIDDYTSAEIKLLRKGKTKILDVPDERIEELFRGFSICLKGMHLEERILQQQIHAMDVRLLYSYRRSRRKLDSAIANLGRYSVSFAENYYDNHLLYEDLSLLTDFITESVEKFQDNIKNIYTYMDDNRCESLYDGAGETGEELNKKILEYDFEESLVWKKLSKDERYLKLTKKLRAILTEMNKGEQFIREFKKEYNKTMTEISKIREDAEMELLGHKLKKVDIPMHMEFDNPIEVLAEAVQKTAEVNSFQMEIKSRPPLTEEEIADIKKNLAKFAGKTPSISKEFLGQREE